jgi:chromosome segregation ATPase
MMRILLVAMLMACLVAPAWAAKPMYKWVDDKGKVHYGDTIPPEYAKQGNEEMSRSGRVIKETPPAATPEQIKAKQEAEQRARELKEALLEQKRRDKALLATYNSLDELDLAEKRNIEQIDLQIKSNELSIKSVSERQDGLKKQAHFFTSRNKPVPPDLADDIKHADDEIAHLRGNIADLNQDKDNLRGRFASDRKRYMELKRLADVPDKPAEAK